MLAFLLSACLGGSNSSGIATPTPGTGAGGTGGTGGTSALPQPAPLASAKPSATFTSSADYDPCFTTSGRTTYCNEGLGQIGAADVYAKGAYGAGVVVAVVDTGIDATHSELANRISADSIDIVSPGLPVTDEVGHGTMVAGVIAAERNDLGTHGVAFESTIMAIRTDGRKRNGSTTDSFAIKDITAAVSYATNKAHVINLSMGIPGTTLGDIYASPLEQSTFERALTTAMSAGSIIVVATGNKGATDPALPAALAGDTTVNASGQMLAVGAINHDGTDIASFSNWCGVAMNYCLVAPGDGLWTTSPGEMLAYSSGTSFSAPYVSGSAALLIQLWPTLAPAEVVDIMLTTATDMGAAGVDPVFGHGMLNMSTAMQPLGSLDVPLTTLASGSTATLSGTSLSLGTAFGDALAGTALLSQAFALDDYDRDFAVDLNGYVSHAGRGFGLDALAGSGAVQTIDETLPGGIRLAMGIADRSAEESPAEAGSLATGERDAFEVLGMRLEMESGPNTNLRFGHDVAPAEQMAGLDASAPATLFWRAGETMGAQHGLVGTGSGFSVSRRIDAASMASFGWVDQNGDIAGRDASIGEFTLAHRFGNGAIGYLGFSNVDEQGAFLGSNSAGGFAVSGAETRFYSLGARYPLSRGLELVGNYLQGSAEIQADGTSMLSDWSDIRAESFGVGLVRTGVIGRRDRIGILAGQPLRVTDGSATVTAPVDYLADKTVVQASERVSMAPTGRETDLQVAYDTPLGKAASLSGWVMMQMEPGHVAGADPAYGVGIRFGTEF